MKIIIPKITDFEFSKIEFEKDFKIKGIFPRFQIRVNDLRDEALESAIPTSIDEILEFFNPIIFEMMTLYSKEIDLGRKKETWK